MKIILACIAAVAVAVPTYKPEPPKCSTVGANGVQAHYTETKEGCRCPATFWYDDKLGCVSNDAKVEHKPAPPKHEESSQSKYSDSDSYGKSSDSYGQSSESHYSDSDSYGYSSESTKVSKKNLQHNTYSPYYRPSYKPVYQPVYHPKKYWAYFDLWKSLSLYFIMIAI